MTPPWATEAEDDGRFDLADIEQAGELIGLTLSGPDTYYDFQGRRLGVQYLLCEHFASHLGVKLRMEVCRDTTELLRRLADGDADLVAVRLNADSTTAGWLVGEGKPMDEIAAGIQMAVAKRCFVMSKKAGATDAITLTGGCAKNAGLKQAIERVLKLKVIELKTDPQLMGALGAAEYARQKGLAKA